MTSEAQERERHRAAPLSSHLQRSVPFDPFMNQGDRPLRSIASLLCKDSEKNHEIKYKTLDGTGREAAFHLPPSGAFGNFPRLVISSHRRYTHAVSNTQLSILHKRGTVNV